MAQISGSGVVRDSDGNQTGTYATNPDGGFTFTANDGTQKRFYYDVWSNRYYRPSSGPKQEESEFTCLKWTPDGCTYWGWTSFSGNPLPSSPSDAGTAKKT